MTIPLTLRLQKGSELTFAELDNNFTALKNAVEAGSGGVSDHALLTNRNSPNQHTIDSITGLREAIPFITTDSFYQTTDGDDYRPAIQRAIDFVEASGIRQEIRISPPKAPRTFHLLKSHYPIGGLPALAGNERHGIVIKKPNLIKIVGAKSRIQVDLSVPQMVGIKSMLSVIPDSLGSSLAGVTTSSPDRLNIPNSIISSLGLTVGTQITLSQVVIGGSEPRPNNMTSITEVGSNYIRINNQTILNATGTISSGVIVVSPQVPDQTMNELHLESLRLQGGAEGTPLLDRPEYIIKADYGCIRYSRFKDLHISVCQKDVFLICGFIILMQHCRARFAGPDGIGFNCVVAPLDGVVTGAKTGYHFNHCTVDFAGLHGFSLTGFNGTTYCKLTNCHVDFVGQNDSKQTIVANVPTTSAYNFDNVWGVVVEACGIEFCTRAITGNNTRLFYVDTLYSLGSGRGDNTATDSFIKLKGFMEQVAIKRTFSRSPRTNSNSLTSIGVETPNRINISNAVIASQLLEVGGSVTINNLSIAGGAVRPNTTATITEIGSNFIRIDNETLINATGSATAGTITSPHFKHILTLETPAQFNASNIEVDSTIPRSGIKFSDVGIRSSKSTLVSTLEDFYESHTRYSRGGAILDGKPLTGGTFNFWLNHITRAAEHSIKFDSAGSGTTTRSLARVLNNTQDGYLTFKIEVMCMNTTTSGGVERRLPATYIGYATCKNGGEGEEVTLFEKLGTLGADYTLTLNWTTPAGEPNVRVLNLSTIDGFGSFLVKMTALGRQTTQTQHFYWE